jgi:quercetin dioxygenase-like cupin family protein
MPDGLIVRSDEGTEYSKGPSLWKAAGRQTGGRFDFLVLTLAYATGPGLHVHRTQEDTFYVLEGVLTVQVGDELYELEPGDFASAPPGVPHTFDNTRKDQGLVKAINLMTPGGYEGYFAEFDELGEQELDPEVVRKICERYEVTYVGPPLREKLALS